MSHVAKVELQVKDLDALEIAARALGLELVRGQTTYKWWGRSVGDYPLPEGFRAEDLGKCLHALRLPGNSEAYEIGVVKSRAGQGYELLWDFYAGGYGLVERVGPDCAKLKQEYSAAVSTEILQRQGFRLSRVVKADGRIVLQAVK